MQQIDYYFFTPSPFTYLGHNTILDVAKKHNAALNYKPVDLMQVWAVSGALPPAKRPPVRQRMRLIELQRLSEFRKLPINLKPDFFPVDPTFAEKTIIAITQNSQDPAQYMGKLFSSVWVDNNNIADENHIADLLGQCGFDAGAIINAASHKDIAAIRQKNTEDAIAVDAVGVPTYVLNGEAFWGQDRIEHLDFALTSGRAAYTA